MHTPTVATFDFEAKTRRRVSSSKDERRDLADYALKPHGLYFRVEAGDTEWRVMQAHVLPELHLQVARFDWREGQSHDYDYYLDVVRVVETGERWVVRDLYLDLIVYEGRKVEILDTDEYLEALAEGHLGRAETEHTLEVTHNTLNELAKHSYSLESYLKEQGVQLGWM